MLTAHSNSVKEDTPLEVKFKAEGVFRIKDDTPLVMYDDCTCQVVVGLEDSCCIKTYVKNGDSTEEMTLCNQSKSKENCQISILLFSKKIATDCSRFKDKQNDIQSINEVNNQMISELMSKREDITELDGNRFEAFAKSPVDARLPIQMISNQNAPKINTDDAAAGADDEAKEATDLSKGMFVAKVFACELGTQASKDKVDVKLDSNEIAIGENLSEKFADMVWPCKDSQNLCKVSEFFETKGFDANFLQQKKKEFDDFKSIAHIASDDFCVIMAFWQNRIIPICLSNEKEVADLNAVAITNFEQVMAYKKFFFLEINKKPNNV